MILAPKHAPLQDTNDHFLANLQKDGTYSVVPRVPGGEITPEKLIVLGQVAKKFGLYTKITGAQRIDLFGARVEQLPLIWQELVDAGFESGHAYGKALRTVKSCVGSTWCRYGVQDSVSMAIRIENRYKGLRAPHKLKLAVSGCTRECAEAQGKDVGVIATEKGWNLYVCGNGGMKPRHADLLATDLDDATLIRYIDRFLMFYIRTADRLQRTSTWLENLEGGIDYVRKVVCEDSLGIGAELEADMQKVVDTYECEWKKAIDDPADAQALPPLREQRRAGPGHRVRHRARASDPGMRVCRFDDIVPDTGVCALVAGEQVAVFGIQDPSFCDRKPGSVFGRECPVARHRRRPEGRAGGRLAGLQAALQPPPRPLRRGPRGGPPRPRGAGGAGGRGRGAGGRGGTPPSPTAFPCSPGAASPAPRGAALPARGGRGGGGVAGGGGTCCYCGVGCGVLASVSRNEIFSVAGIQLIPPTLAGCAPRGCRCTRPTRRSAGSRRKSKASESPGTRRSTTWRRSSGK